MLVTLIGKNVLYKLKLPTKKTGNYWITDDDGKKLINIVGKSNEWQMYSNEQVKILNPQSIKSLNISKIAKDNEHNKRGKINRKKYLLYFIS